MNAPVSAAAGAVETGIWPGYHILFLALLIGVNAFFAASEIAVISVNDTKIRRKADQGHRRAGLLVRFLNEPGNFLATIQVGITLAGFLATSCWAGSPGNHGAACRARRCAPSSSWASR